MRMILLLQCGLRKYQTDLVAYKTAKAAYDVKVAEKKQPLISKMRKLKLSMMQKWLFIRS